MIHALKAEPEFFEAVAAGLKPFEVRVFDRQFEVGDFLALDEVAIARSAKLYSDMGEEDEVIEWGYTGRCILVLVTYLLDDPRFVKDGYCIMGIRPASIGWHDEEPVDLWGGTRKLYGCPVYDVRSKEEGEQSDGDRA